MSNDYSTTALYDVLWADAELEKVVVEYDSVTLLLCESNGIRKRVVCRGHVGLELPGFWDEVIVECGDILGDDPFLVRCQTAIQERFRNTPPTTGNDDRNTNAFRLLKLTLVDGTVLKVAAARFESERV